MGGAGARPSSTAEEEKEVYKNTNNQEQEQDQEQEREQKFEKAPGMAFSVAFCAPPLTLPRALG